MGYIGNFIVYTLAMVGIIVVALLVFKNATSGCGTGKKSKYLQLIDTMSLGQRKMLYIVSTGKEKFLIAGDVDKTSLISKLEDFETNMADKIHPNPSFRETMTSLPPKGNIDRHSGIGIQTSIMHKNSVMKNLAEKIKT